MITLHQHFKPHRAVTAIGVPALATNLRAA